LYKFENCKNVNSEKILRGRVRGERFIYNAKRDL